MAKRAAERAVELAPDSPEVHLALGYYYHWAYRDSEKALKEWEIAEKSLPNKVEILIAKATFFEPQGRWEEAIATLKKAFKLSPRDASIATNLAGLYFFSRRYQQVIEMCNQAIALAPDLTWPYLYKTFTYWCLKDTMKEARSALESVPKDHSWALWTWFWQEFREGHYQDALEHLSSTPGNWIRLTIHARPKSLLAGFVYDSLNKPQLARSAYDTAKKLLETEIRVRPNDPRLHSSLGIVYSALGRKKEAIQEGKLATELLPVSKDAFYGLFYIWDLAVIYTMLGELDKALDQVEYLLSNPTWYSVTIFKLDPRFFPLRDHPRYQGLIKKYSKIANE